jgi:hypothetical protein
VYEPLGLPGTSVQAIGSVRLAADWRVPPDHEMVIFPFVNPRDEDRKGGGKWTCISVRVNDGMSAA